MLPTQRTLAFMRKLGWPCDVVERMIGPPNVPAMRKRKDLFGFIDLVCLDGKPGALGIQCTSSAHIADRVAKIRTECYELAARWLDAGNRIWIIGWAKRGAKGKAKRWTVRVVEVWRDPDHADATVWAEVDAPVPPRAPRKAKEKPQQQLTLEG